MNSLKQLRLGKIILHILLGRLKISEIKVVYNMVQIYEGITTGKINFKKILKVKPGDFVTAINFNNRYTLYQKIDLEIYIKKFEDIIKSLNNPKLNGLISVIDTAKTLNTVIYSIKG